MKTTFFLIIIPFLLALQSDDRDRYTADFKLIQDCYKRQGGIQFTSICRETGGFHSDTINRCTYYFKGKNFYYKTSTTEVLKSDVYLISVDHYKKAIIIYKASEFKDDFMPVNMVDSFLNKNTVTLKYSERPNGKIAGYTMNILKGSTSFNKMEIWFDKTSHFVDNIRLFIAPGKIADSEGMPVKTAQQIEYIFSNYKTDHVDDKIFDSQRFINVNGSRFTASAPFKDFKIIPLVPVQK